MIRVALVGEHNVTSRDALLAYYESIIGDCTDLEALARCAEFAAERAGGDVEDFIHQMGYLIFGQVAPRTGILAGPVDRVMAVMWRRFGWVPRKTAVNRFGSRGFAYDDRSNQVQHFWYAVAVAYRWGPGIADLIARVIEWNPPKWLRWLPFTGRGTGTPEDLHLSRQGIQLGRMIAERRIALGEIGDWVRRELGPTVAPSPGPSPLGGGCMRRVSLTRRDWEHPQTADRGRRVSRRSSHRCHRSDEPTHGHGW